MTEIQRFSMDPSFHQSHHHHSKRLGDVSGKRVPVRTCKVMILGAAGVGKSALVVRYITRRFLHEYDSAENVYTKETLLGGQKCELRILDTSTEFTGGDTTMYDIWSSWSDCFVLVYSITDPGSLQKAIDIKRDMDQQRRFNPAYFILVGNKCDLLQQRRVTEKEGKATADALGCAAFYEVSARDNVSVQTAFDNSLQQPDSKRLGYRRNSVTAVGSGARGMPEKKRHFRNPFFSRSSSKSRSPPAKAKSIEAPGALPIRDPLAMRTITSMRRSSIPW
eukprot:m.10077 g.10077  ORF g.10077 m.10077 type:complete len:278 (+) comp21892_c0_seq1:28-861(+)